MSTPNQYPELEKAYYFFKSIKDKCIREHHKKHILIHNNAIIDVYDDVDEAIKDAVESHGLEPGKFAVHHAIGDDEPNPPYVRMII